MSAVAGAKDQNQGQQWQQLQQNGKKVASYGKSRQAFPWHCVLSFPLQQRMFDELQGDWEQEPCGRRLQQQQVNSGR